MAYRDDRFFLGGENDNDFQLPDQLLPEGKKDEEWYLQHLRHYAGFYNSERGSYSRTSGDDDGLDTIERMIRYYSYYKGQQTNLDYHHFTTAGANRQKGVVWIRGQKIYQVLQIMRGVMEEVLENVEVNARQNTRKAHSRRQGMFNKMALAVEMKNFMKQLEGMGVSFAPVQGQMNMEDLDDVQWWMDTKFRDKAEIVAIDLANDSLNRNEYMIQWIRAFIDVMCTGKACCEHYVDNNEVCWEVFPPSNLIWDNGRDDDFNRYGRFIGRINFYTPDEVIARWPSEFNAEDVKILKRLSQGEEWNELSFNNFNNTHNNFSWWNLRNGSPEIACVTMYWPGKRDLPFLKGKDKFGNLHVNKFSREKLPNKKGSYPPLNDWHQASLIGNYFLADWGYSEFRSESYGVRGHCDSPIQLYVPDMLQGDNVSLVERLHSIQDKMDAAQAKIMEKMSRDEGKVHIINGGALGGGPNVVENLIADFKTMGIHVTQGATGEVGWNPADQKKVVETVDMSIDPNLKLYIELYHEWERMLEEIASLPDVAQGSQEKNIGKGVQETTIHRSSLGQKGLYNGYMEWLSRNLRLSTNISKNLIPTLEDTEAIELRVGERTIKFLDIVKDIKEWQKINVWITVLDVISPQARQRIKDYAFAWSQQMKPGGIDELDILFLENAKSWTELMTGLQHRLKKKRGQSQSQNMMMQMMKLKEADKDRQHKERLGAMKEEGANERVGTATGQKMGADMLKDQQAQEQIQAQAQQQQSQPTQNSST